MSRAIREHIRSNVVGYIALFCFAMGGTAYATHPGGANTISSGDIVNGEVKTADINNTDGVRSIDVRDDTLASGGLGAVDLAPGSVGSSEVAADSLDASDLNAGSVGASEVSDESLGSSDLAPSSVGGSEVAASAIGADEVAPESLVAGDLAPDSVGSSEAAANSIGTGEIIDGQVQNDDLASNSVTGSNVFPSSLTGADILINSLTSSDIAADTLTSSDIGAGAVGSSEVADESLGTGEFASSIPAVHVTRTTNQGVTHLNSATLNFNSERYDTAGMHSTSSNISRLTAPVTGIYEVSASVWWTGFSLGGNSLRLIKNGVGTPQGIDIGSSLHTGNSPNSISTVVRLAAGEFVEVSVFQDSGGTQSVRSVPQVSPEFSMTWLAPGP